MGTTNTKRNQRPSTLSHMDSEDVAIAAFESTRDHVRIDLRRGQFGVLREFLHGGGADFVVEEFVMKKRRMLTPSHNPSGTLPPIAGLST